MSQLQLLKIHGGGGDHSNWSHWHVEKCGSAAVENIHLPSSWVLSLKHVQEGLNPSEKEEGGISRC